MAKRIKLRQAILFLACMRLFLMHIHGNVTFHPISNSPLLSYSYYGNTVQNCPKKLSDILTLFYSSNNWSNYTLFQSILFRKLDCSRQDYLLTLENISEQILRNLQQKTSGKGGGMERGTICPKKLYTHISLGKYDNLFIQEYSYFTTAVQLCISAEAIGNKCFIPLTVTCFLS